MFLTNNSQLIEQKTLSIGENTFTGKLEIKSPNNDDKWYLYFGLGRIIWADGGCHSNRSWQRHLAKINPNLHAKLIGYQNTSEQLECYKYHLIDLLIKRHLISKQQAITLIKDQITEVLFDITQREKQEELEYVSQVKTGDALWKCGLNMSITLFKVEEAIIRTQKEWSIWSQQGFQNWSPNLAPIIKEPEQLKNQLPHGIYQKFTALLKGRLSLRDLAVQVKQNTVNLACSLSPYLNKQWLELIEVPDIEPRTPLFQSTTQKPTNQPMIACIDDSPQVSEIMKYICSKGNYRYMGIQKPLEAIPKLISSCPNFIFLDLTMPIINGYELCAQIKRTSRLKDIPVVILTSNDGMVDRMRAKLVGATDFLGKPVQENKVLNTIQKFIHLR